MEGVTEAQTQKAKTLSAGIQQDQPFGGLQVRSRKVSTPAEVKNTADKVISLCLILVIQLFVCGQHIHQRSCYFLCPGF